MACPICDRPTDTAYRPFCSRRCADVDLGRWLTGGYRVPADDDDDDRAGPAVSDEADRSKETPRH